MKGSGFTSGALRLFEEVCSMVRKCPRMVEARFTFQAPLEDAGPDVAQFDVRLFLRDGRLRVSLDLHGAANGIVEDLDPTVLDAIRMAIETVRGRVKAGELFEQVR